MDESAGRGMAAMMQGHGSNGAGHGSNEAQGVNGVSTWTNQVIMFGRNGGPMIWWGHDGGAMMWWDHDGDGCAMIVDQ